MLTLPPPPPQRKPVGGGYKLIEPLKIKINENLTHSSLTYILLIVLQTNLTTFFKGPKNKINNF